MSELPPLQGATQIRAIFGGRVLPGEAHAGLVFDRYLRIWTGALDAPEKSEQHRDALKAFVTQYNQRGRSDEHAALLKQGHARLDDLAGPAGSRVFRTTFRLTTGLGQQHPLENGFVFDPVIGVPFLPGSSVKGLLRAHMRATGADPGKMRALLGNEPPGRALEPEQSQAGSLVVLPALPASWPALAVDVINCHHPAYYGGARPQPVDWENPVPVYFLAVDAGMDFVFRFCLRPALQGDPGHRDDVAEALQSLEDALDLLGIGAKTAVGYGVMRPANGRPAAPRGAVTKAETRATDEPRPERRPAPAAAAPLPSRGQTVTCRLKEQNKKKKWRVEVLGRAAEGVLDPDGAPEGLSAGQEVTLVVQNASVNQDWAFKWPR